MKFQKFILYFFLLIGIFSSSHALIADSGIPDLSDATICSNITDMVFPEQGMLDEARKRGLKKGKNCNTKVAPPTNPANSHMDGTRWVCDTDYYKSGSACRKVPNNAYSPFTSNFWYCNDGYKKVGLSCVKQTPPPPLNDIKIENINTFIWIVIGIIFAVWVFKALFNDRSGSTSTRPTQYNPNPRPVPKYTPKPKPISQPKPKPISKPKPQTNSRMVIDPQAFLLKIGNYNCNELKKEFQKWNYRLNQAKTDKESKDIQKILDLIGKVRMDKNC